MGGGMSLTGENVNANSNNEIFAIYYNRADLGFGREMHCAAARNGSSGAGDITSSMRS
mgnify:CR=1 FL=1